MKKAFKSYVIIWAILLALFNVIAFVPLKFSPSFWIGYVSVMLAFIGQLICAKIAFDAKNLTKLFYNIPLISLSWTGLVVSFVVGAVCMFVPFIPYWVSTIVCAIVLAFTAIAVVKANVAAEAVEEIDKKIKVQTFFIKSLTVDAESLLARAESEEIKAECKKVYEAVRYSDPMSNDALATIESQITIKFSELAGAVGEGNAESVKQIAKEVCILVDDRNKKCKLLK